MSQERFKEEIQRIFGQITEYKEDPKKRTVEFCCPAEINRVYKRQTGCSLRSTPVRIVADHLQRLAKILKTSEIICYAESTVKLLKIEPRFIVGIPTADVEIASFCRISVCNVVFSSAAPMKH